jgi:endonuclease/exonuclease/phosphatase family metal-dependent hydrolase
VPLRVHSRIAASVGLAVAVVLGLGAVAIPAAADEATASETAASGASGGERAVFGPADGDALHVMSFNLRYASATGANSWPKRRPVMAELLRTERPTVLGTQEGLHDQLLDIARDLPDHYDWIGQGRAGGTRDEYVAIFFDTRRLTALESGHFWLSDTPEVPGSRSWGNRSIRMATWVRFRDKRTGGELAVVNTHLDNASENARVRGAKLIRDRIAAFPAGLPVLLTGDFNAAAGNSAAYTTLVDGAGLTDTWAAAAEHRGAPYGTFHGYHPLVPDGARIDWMLARGKVTVAAAGINTFARDGQYPSDHLPIQALLTVG